MRRYGEPRVIGQVYTDRPGAYAFVRRGSDVLMTIEDHPRGDAPDIQIPGGGIDPGESVLQALHREVMEETGWSIAVERRLGVYQRYCYMPEYDKWARKICHVYLAWPVRRHGPPIEDNHQVFWTNTSDALRLISNPADGPFLRRHLHVA